MNVKNFIALQKYELFLKTYFRTRHCLYMSILLLISGGLWWLFKIPHIDAIGSLGLVYFSIKEGKEAFSKAKGIENCGCQ